MWSPDTRVKGLAGEPPLTGAEADVRWSPGN